MNGMLKITVTNDQVEVRGHLNDSNILDRLAIVDALMNAFDMKGHTRRLACEMLLNADKAAREMDEDKLVAAIESVFKAVAAEEAKKDEG